MTPEQAEQISDELLEERRRAANDAKNAVARRVPFLYYVRGLNALEPWERAELLAVASKHVANRWKAAVFAVALAATGGTLWWALELSSRKNIPPVVLVFVIAAISLLPHAFLVRREIRKRLGPRLDSSSEQAREV